MWTVNVGSKRNHVLMDHSTQECVASWKKRGLAHNRRSKTPISRTELISLAKPNPFGQEVRTISAILILHIGPIAVRLCRGTNAFCQSLSCVCSHLCESQIIGLGRGAQQRIDGPLPPLERGIVFRDLPLVVESVPCVDLNRDSEAA